MPNINSEIRKIIKSLFVEYRTLRKRGVVNKGARKKKTCNVMLYEIAELNVLIN